MLCQWERDGKRRLRSGQGKDSVSTGYFGGTELGGWERGGREVGEESLKGRRQALNLREGWDFLLQRGAAGVIQAKEIPKGKAPERKTAWFKTGALNSVAEPRLQCPVRGRRWGLESKCAKLGAKRRPGSIRGRVLRRALVRLATEIVMAVWRVGLRCLRRRKKPAQKTVAIIQGRRREGLDQLESRGRDVDRHPVRLRVWRRTESA